MKAVIPAAGFGTRFLPATKSQPKEMLPVYDKPTLQFLVEEAVSSGIDDILIITGRNKRSIEDHFDKSYELEYTLQRAGKDRYLKEIRKITDLADICYVRQKDLRGLGDAIRCSEKHVDNEAFAVLLGHTITKSAVPCTRQLINAYEKYNSPVAALGDVSKYNQNQYNILDAEKLEDNIYKIKRIAKSPQNERAPIDLGIIGRYILTPEIFDKIDETEVGFRGEIHLTEALSKLESLYGVVFEGETHYVGNRLEWLKTSIRYALDDGEFRDDLLNYMKGYI
ncbi:UTP--glucose-1-phosphate uridylyltransferase [Methanobrevibacter sp.]|uniref:UTP--glucose-1-phosphate uridylyltransferase n=1 Tax=Methanobrevibacter sp. TaxID=66852 RepID=UPI00386E6EAD